MSVRKMSFVLSAGIAMGSLIAMSGCHQHDNASACCGGPRPPLQSAMENANNEIWRVLDLQREKDDAGDHYSFGFNPTNRNDPFGNTQAGWVSAKALVGVAPPVSGVSALQSETQVIIVRRGSIYAPPPIVEFVEPGGVPAPSHQRPRHEAPPPATQPVHGEPAAHEPPALPA